MGKFPHMDRCFSQDSTVPLPVLAYYQRLASLRVSPTHFSGRPWCSSEDGRERSKQKVESLLELVILGRQILIVHRDHSTLFANHGTRNRVVPHCGHIHPAKSPSRWHRSLLCLPDLWALLACRNCFGMYIVQVTPEVTTTWIFTTRTLVQTNVKFPTKPRKTKNIINFGFEHQYHINS